MELAEQPHELEALYRQDPESFAAALPGALAQRPDALVLQAWEARLARESSGIVAALEGAKAENEADRWRWVWLTVGLSLLAGTLAKLPDWIEFIDRDVYLGRNIPLILMGCLGAYWFLRRPTRRGGLLLAGMIIGLGTFLNLLPEPGRSQTLLLSAVHTAFVAWSLLGLLYLGATRHPNRARDTRERLRYLEFNGEVAVYTGIILLGGIVLTLLTLALFSVIGMNNLNWYTENVVVYGLMASPIVATLLIDRFSGKRFRIAPLISRVFTPLFLVANTLIFIHLLGFLACMVAWFRGSQPLSRFQDWITGYLPVYFLWSCIVSFAFPFLFGFQ